MSPSELQRLARRQLADYDSRSPGTIFADGRLSLTIEDAYRLQIETARLRQMRGEAIAGYKIGCVSQAVQRQLGVTQAVFGHVFESEIRPNEVILAESEFDHLGVEGEFALTIARDVKDPEVLRDAPLRYVSEVFSVIELHNYVFRGPKPYAAELIANNAVHAGIVVSETRAPAQGHEALDISVSIDGEQLGVAAVDPFSTLYELATILRGFGISLHQGDIVLAGSPLPLYRVSTGDRIEVRCPAVGEVGATVGASSASGTLSQLPGA